MSTFDTLEKSGSGSRPVELYEFVIGVVTYRYTSSEAMLTVGGFDYTPEAIKRTDIAQGHDDRARILTVELPGANAFASSYVGIVPPLSSDLTIKRIQRDETPSITTATIYKGRVAAVNFTDDGQTAKIAVQSLEASASRTIPRATYSGVCNWQLFDADCGVNPLLFKFSAVVSLEVGSQITVPGAGSSGIDFRGGFVKPATIDDQRLVIDQSGDVLTMLMPFQSPSLGTTVDCFAGCDHNFAGDCALVFNRVAEFGGTPYVPRKNIFTTGLD